MIMGDSNAETVAFLLLSRGFMTSSVLLNISLS